MTLRRVAALAVLLVIALLIAASAGLHDVVERGVIRVSGLMGAHPGLGALAFTGLAAVSALLAFFSSALLVPVGVHHWGEPTTLALLWAGWLLGGATSYLIGRYVGGGVLRVLANPDRAAFYRERINQRASFGLVLLFQTAVPSEIPGYVLGTARYSFPRYLAALALAELPYALGAVFLGAGFLRRQYALLIVLGTAGIVFLAWAVKRLHRALGDRS